MRIRILLLAFFVSVSNLLFADIGTSSRSKVSDIGRVIYNSDEALLLTKLQSFEAHTNVAVKIVTTFRFHKNYDVTVVYKTELTGDNTIVFVVQTGMWSSLTNDYEPGRFRDDLHADRTENLNKEHLLPAYTVEEIRRRMIERFYQAGHSEDSKNLYESLDLGIETLSGLIYNPVNVKGSLIWESLWNRPDPYITPELAGFIDGSYNTIKGMSEVSDALDQATDVARTIAFNYTFNIDGYRDAMHEMVSEVVTDLDTYIQLANTIVAAEDKLVNIYKGTTMEDRYWRGIIAFEVAGILFPLSKTKVAAKTASGLRGLLDDFRTIKINGVVTESPSLLPSIIRQLIAKPSYKPFRLIFSKPNRTTTFVGKWDEIIDGQQNGLQKVFGELSENDLNIYMQSGKFDHPGGFNMLSIDNFSAKQAEYVQKLNSGRISSTWTFDDYIWEAYNKPWLESALQRGDDIIIWSDPIKSRTGFYKRELDYIQSKASQFGYDYNVGINSGTFSK